MRKNIFTLMALMAALCACNKEQFNESDVTDPVVEPSAPLVFTATMESTPGTKATLDGLTPSWEVADAINLNGFQYKANAAGTSSTFSMVGNGMVSEIRPAFVSGSPVPDDNTTPPALLVDAEGTRTKWCDYVNGDGLFIVVSTGNDCMLNSIKLWNGGDTGSRSGRRWKDVKVYGASSADGPWDSDALLASFTSLNLEANNGGFAGELPVNSTKECKYYRVEVLSTMGESLQQMSDMKFVVCNDLRPTFVSTTTPGHYGSLDASKLVDDSGPTLEWCTPTSAKVDGVWNIVVSTGSPTLLNTIKLWNARNTVDNPGRTWKDVELYGKLSSTDAWRHIKSFDDLKLDINNYGFAGDLEINSSKPYTFYRVDILENKGGTGDGYMQMADMKFTVNPAAPYYAYFPASLFDGFKASLPSTISETWTEGKFNMPMYAQSNTTDLEFKNLCGVLKISISKEEFESIKSIRISSSNKATSGEFTVLNNTAVLKSPDETANTLTVTYTKSISTADAGTVFYIAIPAQTYQNLKIELSSDGENFTKSMSTKFNAEINVERNKIYPINFKTTTLLPGIFSVSATKKVRFAVGNLRYNISKSKWSFFENQYDYGANNYSGVHAKEISLFTWGYGSWSTNPSSEDFLLEITPGEAFSYNNDWGSIVDASGIWRTLTSAEWNYLINTRVVNGSTGKGYSYKQYYYRNSQSYNNFTIEGTKYYGIIIFPDGFTEQDSWTKKYDTWEKINAAGIVFLPRAGARYGTDLKYVGHSCLYWTANAATKNDGGGILESFVENYARDFELESNSGEQTKVYARTKRWGLSVRLVQDVK